MVKILETDKLTKSRWMTFAGVEYYEVDTVGDGNCAFNSLALGLIDLIKRDQLHLSADKQRLLVKALKDVEVRATLDKRIEFHASYVEADNTPYEDLVDGMDQFYGLTGTNFTYEQLIEYIKENSKTRQQIAELHIVLAPALRKIGVALYEEYYQKNIGDEEGVADARRMYEDAIWAGPDHLVPLAQDFLGVNLLVHDEAGVANINKKPNPELPTINILFVPGHMNFMLPANQQDGVAEVISAVSPLATAQSRTAKAFDLAKKIIESFNPANIIAQLNELKKAMKLAAASLLSLNGNNKNANKLIETSAANTKSIMTAMRERLDLSDDNKKIASMKLTDMQKSILRGEYQPAVAVPLMNDHDQVVNIPKDKQDISDDLEVVAMAADPSEQIRRDELLAQTLQESEVLSFLKHKGWGKFFRKQEKVIAPAVERVPTYVPGMVEVKQ